MYISKKLEWLREYYNLVKPLYPKVRRVQKIKIMKASYKSRDRAYGLLDEISPTNFTLSMRTQFQYIDFYPLAITLESFSKIDLLGTLAHELAHCYHWTHSPEHAIITCQIYTIFMNHLKLSGYVDEETELENGG